MKKSKPSKFEKIINGILHYKLKESMPWRPLSKQRLTARIVSLQQQLAAKQRELDQVTADRDALERIV